MTSGTSATSATSASEVISHFGTAPRVRELLDAWKGDQRYTDVVPHVMAHVTAALYEVTADQVAEVCKKTEHALGKVNRVEVQSIKAVANWNPAFAFTYVMHHVVESTTSVPTWKEFLDCIMSTAAKRSMLSDPMTLEAIRLKRRGIPPQLVDDAFHWRIGNAYYSFLRELWIFAKLRESGIGLRAHPLADALFRVDAWFDRTALIIYVGNKHYRDAHDGRKLRANDILRGAQPPFTVETIALKPASRFGVVHLPSSDMLKQVAENLQQRVAGHPGSLPRPTENSVIRQRSSTEL